MANYTRNMRQQATYWAPGPADAFGKQSFAAPVPILCRWQDQAVLFTSAEGKEEVSSAVVYPALPVLVQGYLLLGVSVAADPRNVLGAREIRQVGSSPNLTQTVTLNKAFLR